MSVEEDTELRELIIQKALVPNGCLAKIKAQLRASIFMALSEDEQLQGQQPLKNKKVCDYSQSTEGKLMFSLVKEFLEFFGLYFTLSVYEMESYLGNAYEYEGREKILRDLGLSKSDLHTEVPILSQLFRMVQTNTEHEAPNVNKSARDSNKKLMDQSVQEEQNKSFSTISEEFDSAELSEDSSKLSNEFPKCITEIKAVPKDRLDSTYYVDKNDDNVEQTSLSQDGANDRKPMLKSLTIDTALSPRSIEEEGKSPKFDSPKISSQKSDKVKPKNSLSSLADLPPLQINKARANDTMLLPSLYKKEKPNLKELDKLLDIDFDTLDNYEEDFMSSSEINSNNTNFLASDKSNVNLLDTSNSKSLGNAGNEKEKQINTNVITNTDSNVENCTINQSVSSSSYLDNSQARLNTTKDVNFTPGSTVTSEDFELNSNVEDILHSISSN